MVAFIMCVLAFIEGILFTFFCFELVQEQFESIADNQTYVDDMKELVGKPQAFIDNLFMTMGEDWLWWFVPTRPVLDVNYFEKLYTLKQLKKLREFEEDDYDLDKKVLAKEIKKSSKEKNIFVALGTFSLAVWFFYARFEV